MSRKIKIVILILIVSIITMLIWLWSGYSGFNYEYSKKVEITFSFIGAIIGGGSTLIALYITVNQTKEIQKENTSQIYISNINEKIRDYTKMSEAVDEIHYTFRQLKKEFTLTSSKVSEISKELERLHFKYIQIAIIDAGGECEEKSSLVLGSFNNAIIIKNDIYNKGLENIDCDEFNKLGNALNEIIENLLNFSNFLYKNIAQLYLEKHSILKIK